MESNDWTDAERRVERAAELFEQRKLDEALEELRFAVDINPFNPGWLFNLALTLDELGRYDEAIEVYQKTLQIEPDDVLVLHRLGVNLHRTGRFREALEVLEHASEVDPEFEPSYCCRIASHADLGEHDRAEEAFYLGRLVQEHCPTCYYNMGASLAVRGLLERAIYCWQRTLELQPMHPHVHAKLADAFWQRGELPRARKHFSARLRQSPRDFAALLDLVELLLEMGRVEEAGERIATVPRAVAAGSAPVQFGRGIWLAAQQRLAEAADAFAIVLQIDPTFPRAHLRMAQIRLTAGKLIEAKTHLRSELLLRPDDPQTLRDLSNLLIDTSETRSAVVCLRRLTALRPDDLLAWQNLAVANFLRHQYDDGIAACRRALLLRPGYAPVTHNLAVALGELGRYDEAIALMKPLMQSGDDFSDLTLRLKLLQAKARVGRWFEAAFALFRAPPGG